MVKNLTFDDDLTFWRPFKTLPSIWYIDSNKLVNAIDVTIANVIPIGKEFKSYDNCAKYGA